MAKTREPNFSQKLAWPVEVRGGLLQQLETLAEAAQFIVVMEDWRQRRRYWDRAAELLLKAATTSKQEDILKATRQLARALRREGWSENCGRRWLFAGLVAKRDPASRLAAAIYPP